MPVAPVLLSSKTAKQVSKAFHELEKTEGWPK